MRIHIGIENKFEGRALAWLLDYPGGYAYGKDGAEAILRCPQALLRYKEWVDSHVTDSWIKDLQDFDIHLEESFETYTINESFDLSFEGKEVGAWFRHDWKPLSAEDICRGMLIQEWSRMDLLELVASLTPMKLSQQYEGERWSILGVLEHIANAEHWYLDRLGLASCLGKDLPGDAFERLLKVRTSMNEVLPTLEGLEDVRGVEGEFWSPRKILRRATWHEIDHIEHIFKLIAKR